VERQGEVSFQTDDEENASEDEEEL